MRVRRNREMLTMYSSTEAKMKKVTFCKSFVGDDTFVFHVDPVVRDLPSSDGDDSVIYNKTKNKTGAFQVNTAWIFTTVKTHLLLDGQ